MQHCFKRKILISLFCYSISFHSIPVIRNTYVLISRVVESLSHIITSWYRNIDAFIFNGCLYPKFIVHMLHLYYYYYIYVTTYFSTMVNVMEWSMWWIHVMKKIWSHLKMYLVSQLKVTGHFKSCGFCFLLWWQIFLCLWCNNVIMKELLSSDIFILCTYIHMYDFMF